MFDRVGWGLRPGAAVLGYHREGDGLVLGVPRAPVKSPFCLCAGVPHHCGRVTLCGLLEVRAQPPVLFRGSVGRWHGVVARQ